MKKSLLTILVLLITVSAIAVPAHPGKRTGKTTDGRQIEYRVVGDELYHYMVDAEGNMLTKNAEGLLLKAGAQPTEEQVRARRAASRVQHKAAIRRAGSNNLVSRGLVILVNYKNTKFQTVNTREAFNEMLNGDNYTYNGATGSVRKYYSDQSDGKFVPELDVYGPVTLDKDKEYYGANDADGYDLRVGAMVAQACQKAFSEYTIDMSKYDVDNDGYVDFVDVLYAGYGEADSDDEDSVWPCEWELTTSDYGRTITIGGKIINTFSCHQELDGYGSMAGKRAGIGTPCHEFGHVFGLPDLYDTSYKNPTLGYWDLMDGGAYNNNSRTPPGFSGYERMFAGWAKPRLLNAAENVTLQELQGSQEVLVISTTGNHNLDAGNPNPTTFYILENRQQKSWDKYLPGHGMLIWKIQYSASKWENNTVNNASVSRQGVAIMAADGKVSSTTYNGQVSTTGDAGDPFPGSKSIKEYKSITNYPITDIAEKDGIITFKFMGGATKPFTVTFNAGEHGTCAIDTLAETKAGAGVVLPDVVADEDWLFLGWSTQADAVYANAGQAGGIYHPTENITLYALYLYTICNVTWNLENVTVEPEVDKVTAKDTLVAVVKPAEGYVLTIRDFSITIVGDATTATIGTALETNLVRGRDFTYVGDTLTIPNVSGNLNITVKARMQGQELVCENYRYTFAENPNIGDNVLGDYSWNILLNEGEFARFDETKGAHFGSNKNPVGTAVLTTDDADDCDIKSIVVNASVNSGKTGGLKVTIGGNNVGEEVTLDGTPKDFTFTNTDSFQGSVMIRITASSTAAYLKSIHINYTDDDTGIEDLLLTDDEVIEAVYNIFGQKVADTADRLTQGIYIIKTNHGSKKIAIQ